MTEKRQEFKENERKLEWERNPGTFSVFLNLYIVLSGLMSCYICFWGLCTLLCIIIIITIILYITHLHKLWSCFCRIPHIKYSNYELP